MVGSYGLRIVLVIVGILGAACVHDPEIQSAYATQTALEAQASAIQQQILQAEAQWYAELAAIDAVWADEVSIYKQQQRQRLAGVGLVLAGLVVVPLMAAIISFSIVIWLWSIRLARKEAALAQLTHQFRAQSRATHISANE